VNDEIDERGSAGDDLYLPLRLPRPVAEPAATDWSAYRACRTCGASTGRACRTLSGTITGGRTAGGPVELKVPHRARKVRTGR
jgi:hypothetical protein